MNQNYHKIIVYFLILIGMLSVANVNAQSTSLLIYEKNLSPIGAAENILTIRHSIFDFQNKFLPNQITTKKKLSSKLANVGYRFLKFASINRFLDNLSSLTQHEIFGHGYRQREFGFTGNSFKIKVTLFSYAGFARLGIPTTNRLFTSQESAMRVAGGPEASIIMSETILAQWVRNENILLADVNLFIKGFKLPLYLSTNYEDDLLSDVELYLRDVNRNYGYVGVENYQYTLEDLRKQALIELLNPYIFYSVYAFTKDYLWDGKDESKLPMIKLGNIKYMPYFKLWLAPYGPEFQFNNIVKTQRKIFQYYFRLGDDTFDAASWGTGITVRNLFQNNWLQISTNLDLWHQPELVLGGIGDVIVKDKGFGGAIKINSSVKIFKNENGQANLYLSTGYKTKGYLQGEALTNTFINRFGLSFFY